MTNNEELQLCLKWNNFGSIVTSSFQSLLVGNELVDVTLSAEGQQFQAHRLILAACSPYFRDLLKINPCQHPIIILREVSSAELKRILIFIYEGQVNVPHSCLPGFMRLAAALNISGLADAASCSTKEKNNFLDSKSRDNGPNSQIGVASGLPSYFQKKSSNFNDDASRNVQDSEKRTCYPPDSKRQRVCSPAPCPSHLSSASSPAPASSPPLSTSDDYSRDPQDLKTDIQDMLEVKLEPDDGPARVNSTEVSSGGARDSLANSELRSTMPLSIDLEEEKGAHSEGKAKEASEASTSSADCTGGAFYILPKCSAEQTSVHQQLSLKTTTNLHPEFPVDSSCHSLPYPCPFCDKAYMSWGFRRRHIKGCHTASQELPCKWCLALLPSHTQWEEHVQKVHNLTVTAARNGLLILEEAHMVLQFATPTRMDSLMEFIKTKKTVPASTSTASTTAPASTVTGNSAPLQERQAPKSHKEDPKGK